MATFTGKLKQKTGTSSYDILHPETEAGVVSYDHTSSGLQATTVQGAIDEIVSSGVGVTGVKGDAESTYRTGDVNLTPANIGAIATSARGAASGVASLDSNAKILLSELPDVILGQMVYGGVANSNDVAYGYEVAYAELTVNAKTKLGTSYTQIELPAQNSLTQAYEGLYFIWNDNNSGHDGSGTVLDAIAPLEVGDWIVVAGLQYKRVDNTDAVKSVNNKTGVVVLNGTDILYSGTPGASNAKTINQKIDDVAGSIAVTYTSINTTGSGNAITGLSISNGQITATKNTTFLTSAGTTSGTYSAVTVNSDGLVTAGGQVLEVISNGTPPTVVNGGWYFEKDT